MAAGTSPLPERTLSVTPPATTATACPASGRGAGHDDRSHDNPPGHLAALQQGAGEREDHRDAAHDHADRRRVGLAHSLDHEQVEQHQPGGRERDQPHEPRAPAGAAAGRAPRPAAPGRPPSSAALGPPRAGSPPRGRRRPPASRPGRAPWRRAGIRGAWGSARRAYAATGSMRRIEPGPPALLLGYGRIAEPAIAAGAAELAAAVRYAA